ncbi:MAG: hypothetical protein AAFR53_08340 [Pseudomonadota bacterium]
MTIETFTADDAVSALALVETHLGEEAFILSMDREGDGVVVRAATHAPASSEFTAAPLSFPGRAARRPRFLDPARPKPFPERAEARTLSPLPPAEPAPPQKLVFKSRFAPAPALSEADMAAAARKAEASIETARYIVVATHSQKVPFVLTIELLRKFPRAQVLRWQDGDELPWVSEPAEVGDLHEVGEVRPQPKIVLCRASGQTFSRVMAVASARDDVTYLLLTEGDRTAEACAAIEDLGAGCSVTGTVLIAGDERPNTNTIRRVAESGLVPVWTLHQGKLSPLFDEGAATRDAPKIRFLRHSDHVPPPRVGAA